MARVNVFASIENESRTVNIGGRGKNNALSATINTDNATNSDCALKINAWVEGHGIDAQERKIADKRKSVFMIELPEQNNEFCEVFIVRGGRRLNIKSF